MCTHMCLGMCPWEWGGDEARLCTDQKDSVDNLGFLKWYCRSLKSGRLLGSKAPECRMNGWEIGEARIPVERLKHQ